jgi:pilus assembly protein CpaB
MPYVLVGVVLRSLSRFLACHRRLVAACLAALAVVCGLSAVRQPAGVAVLTAVRDLPGGRLAAADVVVALLPPSAVPDGALRAPADSAGRVLAGPVRRGEVLTDARLLGPGLLPSGSPDLVATPVRMADAGAARLLAPGDVIDVLAAFEGGGQALAVASSVRVLAIPSTRTAEGALLVLATTGEQAAQLAQARAQGQLSIAIHPR